MKVLFIPWFYAKPKNINKYLQLYKKKGINPDIINYRPVDALFYSGHHSLYNRFKKDKKDYDMVHCVSGGSLVLYNLIKGGWTTNKIIFDSCPMFPTLDCTVNYLKENNNKMNLSEETLSKIVKNVWHLDSIIYKCSNNYASQMLDDYNNIVLDQSRKMIILTDPDDKIVQHNKISKDINIPTVYFKNSKHAQHLRSNPEKYEKALEAFINE